jgi:hypothetical protein
MKYQKIMMDSLLSKGRIFMVQDELHPNRQGNYRQVDQSFMRLKIKISVLSCRFLRLQEHVKECEATLTNAVQVDFERSLLEQYRRSFCDVQKSYEELEALAVELEDELLLELGSLGPRRLHANPNLKLARSQLLKEWCQQTLESLKIGLACKTLASVGELLPKIHQLAAQCMAEIKRIKALKVDSNYVDTHLTGYYLIKEKVEEFKLEILMVRSRFDDLYQQGMLIKESFAPMIDEWQIGEDSYPDELAPAVQDGAIRKSNRQQYEEIKTSILEQRRQYYRNLRLAWSSFLSLHREYCIQLAQIEKMPEIAGLPYKMFVATPASALLDFVLPESALG